MESIPAIYEDGVFKPIKPVTLPERTEVMISLTQSEPASSSDGKADERRAALRDLLDRINSDPRCEGPQDGWSAANNVDDVLYGGPDGPA